MKATGIVRKVDELGRVVLPIELRRNLEINEKDPLEIYLDNNKIILKKHIPSEEKMQHLKTLDDIKILLSGSEKERIERVINFLTQ
ncbi:AbrB/MazE/SpoVT family DNA-binding domain-containing protein [Halobacillus salinus]|uniref:AbrB/MazE/SpoVT family DNA-binding domain-containing protein n=1 Tax=Halobacillus salinus TaxID=192814 RepID=A0A4Z0H5K2_9BACI|nr:AbrB/MazE/SpoVT family DNA-binding domain-containing protein [Halobacillus salinus]TGB04711.1 AbrB/MazE/SpoVT family DNA-binding domain-containing protein [Halobacillus salinus]